MAEEKRKMERFNLGMLSQIRIMNGDPFTSPLELVTKNVCAGGAYFNTENPLPVGAKLSLFMTLQVSENKKTSDKLMSIEIKGTVIRREKDGMAIRFDNGYRILPLAKKAAGKKP